MLRPWIVLLATALTASTAPPTEIQLEITKKVPLEGELEDLVTFGLLKEMSCDSDGHIFSPSTRKYGSADNAVVRFTHDATSFKVFSIETLKHLEKGAIVDFELESNGGLFVLAREVLKYSEEEVPTEFGDTFLLHYDKGGKVLSQLLVKLDINSFTPTALTVLANGEFVVAGYRLSEEKTFVILEKFGADGNFDIRLTLNPMGTRTSNAKTVSSMRVVRPAMIKANGRIYLLRGTTTEPIYILSESGKLEKTLQLKPAGVEFDSPKIVGNNLLVSKHRVASEGVEVLNGPRRVDLPIFNLESGELEDEYYWHEETLGLACYSNGLLTFVGQDESTRPPGWAIFEARPASRGNQKAIVTGR